MQWQADRCAGAWYNSILASFATLHKTEDLGRFLTIDAGFQQEQEGDLPEWLSMETDRLESFLVLLVELASARTWSQMQYTNCFPHCFAGVLHDHKPTAKQLLAHQKKVFEAILTAEPIVSGQEKVAKDIQKQVLARMHDICWNQLQLAREIYVECARADFQVDDKNIQLLARRIFGNPYNTKFDLEDAFAHLTSIAKLSSLATPMSKPSDLISMNHKVFFPYCTI